MNTRTRCWIGICAVAGVASSHRAEADWIQTAGPEVALLEGIAARDSLVLAGGAGALFRSTDGGASWAVSMQGIPPGRRISEFAFLSGRILASGPFAGLFESTDGGLTWSALTDRLPDATVTQFFVEGDDVYAVNARSLFVSQDEGDTWTEITVPDSVGGFFVHQGVFFVGSGTARGVLRSFNRGVDWEFCNTGLPFDLYEQFAGTPTALFVAGRSGLFRSTDFGDQWVDVGSSFDGGPRPVALLSEDSSLYLASGGSDHLHRTSDDGETWESASTGLPQGSAIRPSGLSAAGTRLVLATDQGVYRSSAGGDVWEQSNSGMIGAQVRGLSGARKTLLSTVAVARPVFRTRDGGHTWLGTTEGLPVGGTYFPQYFSIAAFRRGPAFVGTDRYGVFLSQDQGRTWGADNAGYPQYNGTAGNQYREAAAIVRNSGSVFVGTGYGTEFFDGSFHISGGGVCRQTDAGSPWSKVNTGFPIIDRNLFNEPVYAPVNAMYADDGVVLASTFTRGIFRSENDGGSWSAANDGLPRDRNGFPPEFSAFVKVEGDLLASAEFFSFSSGGEGVFRSTDRGLTWTRSDAGLPGGRAVVSVANNNGIAYASVWSNVEPLELNGVYVSDDGGFTWARTPGLEGVVVGPLTVNKRGVFAGTSGAGVWRLVPE